jgi:hypothetical protein
MSGPSLSIPTNTTAFTSLADSIKQQRKELKELNKEVADLQKFGQKVSRETIDKIRAAEQRLSTLQTKQKQYSNVGTQDFMSPSRNRIPFGPEREPAFNFFNEKGSTAFAGDTSKLAGMINRGEALRTAMNGGDVFGAMKLQALNAMHMRGGIAGRAATFIENGGIARVGAAAAYVTAGASIVQGIGMGMSPYSEEAREREQQAKMFESRGELNPLAREVHDANLADQRRNDKWKLMDKSLVAKIPLLGGVVKKVAGVASWVEGRLKGTDAASRFGDETDLSMKRSGIGNLGTGENAEKFFKKRALSDTFGSDFLGNLAYGITSKLEAIGIKSNDLAEKAGQMRDKSLDGFKKLEAEGFQRISENNFSGAEVAFKEAAKELSRNFWRNPMDTWFQLDAGRKADIGYAASQNPLPAVRIGY